MRKNSQKNGFSLKRVRMVNLISRKQDKKWCLVYLQFKNWFTNAGKWVFASNCRKVNVGNHAAQGKVQAIIGNA
jgi:hypothetical protein